LKITEKCPRVIFEFEYILKVTEKYPRVIFEFEYILKVTGIPRVFFIKKGLF